MTENGAAGASDGILKREEKAVRQRLVAALTELGIVPRGPIDLRPIPFEGSWGVASSVCLQLAGDLGMQELEAAGQLEGLSKKEAKRIAGEATRERAQTLAAQVVERLNADPSLAAVE